MKKILIIVTVLASFLAGWLVRGKLTSSDIPDFLDDIPAIKDETIVLSQYSIESLSSTDIKPGKLEIGEELNDTDNYGENVFSLEFQPDPKSTKTKNVTGQINIPKEGLEFPIIVMLRGYVDQKLFQTGDGTRNAAGFFAKNAFITIAPDFLGYGGSDEEAGNIFESRFQTYTTTLSLIKSLNQVKSWDKENILIWAHSNGGQIALTVLEVTKSAYPTVLWAPVSKPFPYSVLYYTDESEDGGKLIRNELSKFEKYNDADKFSLSNYLDNVATILQIHQGTSDDAIPVEWTNDLVAKLKANKNKVSYYSYQGADHNLRPVWDSVVEKDVEFFQSNLKD